MWSSRDLAIVIITAVTVLVLSVTVFTVPYLITGIHGIGYITTVGMALIISLTFLLFEGKRWRFLAHNTLVVILSIPTFFMGVPFDMFPRLVSVLAGIPADIILNTFYQRFSKSNRLVWWSILCCVEFFLVLPILQLLFFPLYFPQSYVEAFSNILIIMSPWIIGGAIVGGYLGYKVYQRIMLNL